ncbi:MAG: class I SAM-dependent rRNA methyltransferase [Calditrichaeota bacterium]|nr:class I SAM-dependent rRNA methyltransferase [Calditrichota bacterium]RQV93521.1 MAG: class I SAM-dependent rRNA methyltransferase [bacterium]RQW06435.1 MAG: class I SAM-dependent rRNA methyltransferase [Calditrichota bacterium]
MDKNQNLKCRVYLKKGRDKSVRNYHPWIFSGAVQKVNGSFNPGDIVGVYSNEGQFLAKGFLNPGSQIRIRILTFEDESIDDQFLHNRLTQALQLRMHSPFLHTTAYRIINGDGDYMPGLIVDCYNDILVMQIFSLGMHRLRRHLMTLLKSVFKPAAIVERSEGSALAEEGLSAENGIIYGELPNKIIIQENNIRYVVDVLNGQKTGFFLDQRDNRLRISALAENKRLLNCFSYTGGFSVAAAQKGASTTSVDVSASALEIAKQNFSLNGLESSKHEFVEMNAFNYFSGNKDVYEVIVLDPPAFIKKRSHLPRGARAYQEINKQALQILEPEGILLSCSCSAHVSWELFQKILFSAAKESGRKVRIIGKFSQPLDHPVNIYHPEGEYLKSFLLSVH